MKYSQLALDVVDLDGELVELVLLAADLELPVVLLLLKGAYGLVQLLDLGLELSCNGVINT